MMQKSPNQALLLGFSCRDFILYFLLSFSDLPASNSLLILIDAAKWSLRRVVHKQSNKVHKINRREETKNLVMRFGQLCLHPREC
ncbi:hypothetical protein Lalb_Chr12g0198161 [Lupinus albus]|uniref:Uncharacterized protein n=1 Tax=Lupinus albus TaxID=3870 RepID=A0A6A4PLY7_LUPAL|nr:hypothetical protein Lalb_Chr12g0198161 [Lupinus albus]